MNWNQRYAHDAAHLDWLDSRGFYTPWHQHVHLEPQDGIKTIPEIDDIEELKRHLIHTHGFSGSFWPDEFPTHPRVRERGGPKTFTLPSNKWLEYLHSIAHGQEVEDATLPPYEPETHRHYPTTVIQDSDY